MAEYGLHKNGEGYADPTAFEGIRGRAKPGEIYEYKGKEVLIIKNQGGYCNVLTVCDFPGKGNDTVEIAGGYVTPGKINYTFNDQLAGFVRRIANAEFDNVLQSVADAFDMMPKNTDEPAENFQDPVPMVEAQKEIHRNEKLQIALGMLEGISYGVSERAAEGINKVIKMIEGVE